MMSSPIQNADSNQVDKIAVQKVIQSELSQLKKDAKVYQKQPDCDIFFRSSVEQEMKKSKKTLDDLMKEYQEADTEDQY